MKHRKVGNVMTSEVVSVRETAPFKEVASLLARHRISGLPVVDDDEKVVGVISETDLLLRQVAEEKDGFRWRLWRSRAARADARKAVALTADRLMSTPAVTVRADESIVRSARIMAEHRIERLPVLDEENRLVGIVTRRDLLQVFLRPDADILADVVDEVLVRSLWLTPQAAGVTVADGVVTLEGQLERTSEVRIAGRMTSRIDGVVAVINRLTARYDDSDLQPTPSAAHGVAEEWLRKL
jgi:CBS domain-containing protein